MAKKQLDLNAPLLSVRRFSSPTRTSEGPNWNLTAKSPPPNRQQSLPVCKLDWECGEVTKPAAVPFHWEKTPGRPKGEGLGPINPPQEPSNPPRLPPGRVSNVIRYNSGESPKLPPGRIPGFYSRYNSGERSFDPNVQRSQIEALAFADHAVLLQKLNESLNSKDEYDIESGEDAYSDALDVLSHAESWSLNYSVSGLSGYQGSDGKPSGTFSVDQQTRDFMMNRFLPAAKAVVLETPQYVVKKQSAVVEQPKPIKKVVSGEQKPLLKPNDSNVVPHYSQHIENVESDDEDEECSVPVKKSGKAWGILPRFCVKNSLCLLNLLPALKSKNHASTSAAVEVRRLTRNSQSGPLDKNACHAIQKKKFHSGVLSRELLDIGNKLTSDSSKFSYSSDSYKPVVSPLRQSRSGPISPYRNEAPKSPFHEGAGFLGVPKEVEKHNVNKIASSRKLCKALQDVSRNLVHKEGSAPPTGAVEKTLYVDFVNSTDCSIPKEIADFSCKNLKSLIDGGQAEEIHAVKSSDQETYFLNTSEEGRSLTPKLHRSEAPKSPCREVGFLSAPKEVGNANADKIASSRKLCKALQDVSRKHMQKQVWGSPGNAVEKTLYMDPATNADHSNAEKVADFSGKNLKSLAGRRQIEEKKPVKSSNIDTSSPDNSLEEKSRSSKLSESTDMILPSACKPEFTSLAYTMKNFKPNQSLDQEFRPVEFPEVHSDKKSAGNNKKNLEPDDQRDADSASLKSPLPPPLPKSPSESWLWRTLPSISLRNPFSPSSHSSRFHPKKQSQKGITNNNTWETIVKTSNSLHDNARCLEELIPHVSHMHNKT